MGPTKMPLGKKTSPGHRTGKDNLHAGLTKALFIMGWCGMEAITDLGIDQEMNNLDSAHELRVGKRVDANGTLLQRSSGLLSSLPVHD
eukprot:scaffold419918_cov34-Prasinocladus_malaysianus.AAC.1